jgi:hypothetical protein
VKICSLYGAGFYYIPGTDICLKVGGWVRAEYIWGTNGSTTTTPIADVNSRTTNNQVWRSRGYITADARNQSAYGTVRGYIAVGLSTSTTGGDNGANQFDSNRAFIQWAGFTFGRATSFFDFYNAAAPAYIVNYANGDTGDPGWNVAAYTAQFGNGFSATISAENRRNTQIIAGGTAAFAGQLAGGNPAGQVNGVSFSATGNTVSAFGAYGGWQVPDITANVRLDQAWGSAQLMGALHQINNSYYLPSAAPTAVNQENSGHAGDKWGYAVGAGLKLNAPMIGPGDYLQAQVNYSEGATRYAFFAANGGNYYMQRGNQAQLGVLSDAVVGGSAQTGNGTSAELTRVFGVNASYEHFWNPAWRTSVYGGYAEVRYSTLANALVCTAQGWGTGAFGTAAVAQAGCNNNWNTTFVGTRTQWNVTKDFYLGLDVLYQRNTSASTPTGFLSAAQLSSGTGTNTAVQASAMDNWTARIRVHRDFMP